MKSQNHNSKLKTFTFLLVLLPFTFLPFTFNSYAQPVSSGELIEKAKAYDNQVVEYQGEAVGDVMARGNFAWVNLNDGKNAIGIWGNKDAINSVIKHKGGYNCKGDILLASGIFHRACPYHGGDLDIHLNKMMKVKEGFATPHKIRFSEVMNTIALAIVTIGLSILCAFKAKRK